MTGNGYANRIAHLCVQFKLPTVGAEVVNRFTRAGHDDALSSLLEVWRRRTASKGGLPD